MLKGGTLYGRGIRLVAATLPLACFALSGEAFGQGAAGAADKTFSHLVITGNVMIKLNDGGLRAKYVPLAGVSYTF